MSRKKKLPSNYVVNRSELEKYLFFYNVQTEEELAELLQSEYNLILTVNKD